MHSKLHRSKACKNTELRPESNQEQKDGVIVILSDSDCSDVEALGTHSEAPRRNDKQNICRLQVHPPVAPVFLRSCKKKTSKCVSNLKRQPENIEMERSACEDSCLREIQDANPTFPVHQVFSTLQKKACLQLGQNATANDKEITKRGSSGERSSLTMERASPICGPPEKPHRANKLSRTRRLKYESGKVDLSEGEPDCQLSKTSVVYQKEPFNEDVLWTDKYSPVCSSEVVGNTVATEQLHTWLTKWKLRTDVEQRIKHKELLKEQQNNDCWDCGDFEHEVGTGDETEKQLCNTVLLTGPPGSGKTASVYACAKELGFKVFEVNCSSQRSGQEVLAQLKEATQSHLVETSGIDALKPAFFNSGNKSTFPVKTLKKATGCSFKNKTKKRWNKKDNAITLTSYFKTKAKADYLYHSGIPSEKSANESNLPAVCADHKLTRFKKMATSLILFEEVDVVFEDDVGFLAAIKTFMKTTKRPVVLITTDPLFRERFRADLDGIIFQTPSMADVCSYLQLVCLAEKIQLDSDDVSALFKVTQGDVRQCLLQLQFWANSGGSRSTASEREFDYKSCSANMLGLGSVKQSDFLHLMQEQQITELLQPMVESWRNGFPMLYSNLELLLHADTKVPFCHPQQMEITPSQYSTKSAANIKSRLSRKKCLPPLSLPSVNTSFSQLGMCPKDECSADKIELANNLSALLDFFDLMSFIDAFMPFAPELTAPCQVENFTVTGAKILDGQLDEMREEEDKSQEMRLDFKAAVEALTFLRCKNSIQGVELKKRGDFQALSNTRNLNFVTCPNIFYQRRIDLNKNVLKSQFFSQLHNTRAALTDYLPFIRFICRTHRKRPKERTEELVKYLKSIRTQLCLEKKTVYLLAGEFF